MKAIYEIKNSILLGMQLLYRFSLIAILAFLLTLGSCTSNGNEDTPLDRVDTGGIKIDSSKSTQRDSSDEKYFGVTQAYICVNNVPIFSDTLLTRRIGSLQLGDSVEVIGGNSRAFNYLGYLKPNAIYKIKFSGRDSGYIHGAVMGMGWHADIDNEPGNELITARYTSIQDKYVDEVADNPVDLQVLKGNKLIARLRVAGYSEMSFQYLGDKGFKAPLKFFEFATGYPACGYPYKSFLVYYNGAEYKVLTSRESTEDADVFGVWSDYIFPSDSLGKPDRLTIYDRHFEADDADTIQETTKKEVYTYSGNAFLLSERDTIARPYRHNPFTEDE